MESFIKPLGLYIRSRGNGGDHFGLFTQDHKYIAPIALKSIRGLYIREFITQLYHKGIDKQLLHAAITEYLKSSCFFNTSYNEHIV